MSSAAAAAPVTADDPSQTEKDLVAESEDARKQLEELQVQTIFSLVEPMYIHTSSSRTLSKLLFLTNRQARQLKVESLDKFQMVMGIREKPQFVINLKTSLATLGTGARFEAHWATRRHAISPAGCPTKSTTEHCEPWGLNGLAQTDRRIAVFLRECVLPLAVRTRALVIIGESNYCSLARAFGEICAIEAAKDKDGVLPFTVLHIGSAEKYTLATERTGGTCWWDRSTCLGGACGSHRECLFHTLPSPTGIANQLHNGSKRWRIRKKCARANPRAAASSTAATDQATARACMMVGTSRKPSVRTLRAAASSATG